MNTRESEELLENLKSRFPEVRDLNLDRPRRLLADLGHPERKLPPIVHIAGTNGKGSTLAMVRAGLEAEGKRVHTFISPHLTKFHERIRLAGELIEEGALVDVLRECESANKKPITLFEVTVCAAFLAFSKEEADALLLEVGLGGRLDATNVVDRPKLSVITSVSLDHQKYLGDSLAGIAAEKAGILRSGVPCIVSRQEPEALAAIENAARSAGAPLLRRDREWWVEKTRDSLLYKDETGRLELPPPTLVGVHQTDNAGTAVAVLRRMGLSKSSIEKAVTTADWPARMQKLSKGPLVEAAGRAELWLDGGHNPAAGEALAYTLKEMPAKTTRIICGMLGSKDVRGFLQELRRAADKLYGITIPGSPAALEASAVAATASEVGFAAEPSVSAEDAVRRIAADRPGSRILVCGSLYLAGSVLRDNR